MRRLLPGSPLYLQPGHTWIIVLGSIQIALSAILRDDSEQKAYDRNLKDYVKSLDKAVLDVGKLNLHASATSTEETPDTKVLTGIRGNYTAAWKVGEGGMGSVSVLDTLYLVVYSSRYFSGSIANAELADYRLR